MQWVLSETGESEMMRNGAECLRGDVLELGALCKAGNQERSAGNPRRPSGAEVCPKSHVKDTRGLYRRQKQELCLLSSGE